MLPFLEVTHLPSSSSFYSAILQPLGLRYLSAEPSSESQSVVPIVTYGTPSPPTPVFQLRQVAAHSIRLSRIVLTAPSTAAVAEFHSFALRANPDLEKPTSAGAREAASTTESRARILDFDGNTMEVAYLPPPDYPTRYGGSTVRKTQSTPTEAARVLDWNYGVATSAPPRASTSACGGPRLTAARRPSNRFAENDPYSRRRSVPTTVSSVYEPTASPRQNSSGLSTGAVVGTLLGVAAGAAFTYSMVKNDQPHRAARQEFDPPAFARRSTFPEPFPDQQGRYVHVERNVEKVRHPSEYPPVVDRRPPPEYIARYSQVGASKSREADDVYDDSRSRHSSRYRPSAAGSVRTRSEASTSRKPLLITDSEHRSFVGSKHSNSPPITRSVVHRSNTYDIGDRESYTSARSQRSASTIRGAPVPPPGAPSSSQLLARSRAGSRVTTTTIKVGGGNSPSPHALSRAGSYVSARNVPLPPSAAGNGWHDWDDDAGSIAPSDSISCVGSRRSGRSYH
ncbi:hypothetical protein QBC33DRAFT_515709 [Phialemonium atrogriseum]|uniref:VOC domain-containing protein n=1 Tax=Phialemonium atrogriseum TaxID=1093897 RepID=A0AAJ0C0B9_9PEZI|nr:uncharacterized protein QBC33DRAFT_515709 [Phialemonium atrogriseum]KAK1766372.1 hypothetical protein QBC33DRAFT_515709 [Phialemonium atrogriseum]